MRYDELTRKLRRLGIVFDRQGSRHEFWVNTRTGQDSAIPRHRDQEVPPGTLSRILKDLGVSRDEFDKA